MYPAEECFNSFRRISFSLQFERAGININLFNKYAFNKMIFYKKSIITYYVVGFLIKISFTQSNLIHFGGVSTEGPKSEEYYMMSDNDYPTNGPSEELKRTQRSFWKKFFKNGWFGNEACNNNCRYDAGDGNRFTISPVIDPTTPPFQGFRPLPTWRPFQPLFGGNCQRCVCPGNNYNYVDNPPIDNNYSGKGLREDFGDISNPNIPASEDTNKYTSNTEENNQYETVSASPNENETPYGNSVTNPTYENAADSISTKNLNNNQLYEKKDVANARDSPIIYQPIIYVSPQFQEHASSLIKPASEVFEKPIVPSLYDGNKSFQAENDVNVSETYKGLNEVLDSTVNNTYDSPKTHENNAFEPPNCVHCPVHFQMSTPFVGGTKAPSPVPTVYSVMKCNSLSYDSNAGPSKYSLFPSNIPPMFDESKPHNSLLMPSYYVCPELFEDHNYRTCPELFEDYNRQIRTLNHCSQYKYPNTCNSGNTFINAQVISY